MTSAANLIAGMLIGMFASAWSSVVASCAVWGLVWCLYLCISKRHLSRMAVWQGRPSTFFLGSTALSFWLLEWMAGFMTSLVGGTVAYYLPLLG